jgi:protein-S-isoprenylcysteine O-methyltransferase Ste14
MIVGVNALELKIPPPAVAALMAGGMWGIASVTPSLEMPAFARLAAALALVLAGAGISLAGVIAFRRARTTVNPLKPQKSSSLVCSGLFSVTRKPMYVGLALVLIAWAVFLSSAWALLGPPLFVLYIDRFQIVPEERILSSIFGAD